MSDKPLPPRPPLPDRPTADRQRSWTSQREPPAFGQGDDWSSGPSSPALSTTSFDLKGSNLKSSTKVGEDGRLQLDLRFAKFLPDLPPGYANDVAEPFVEKEPAHKPGYNKWAGVVPNLSILIMIVGSRGDVQPFLALALALIAHGHRVRIATHGVFADWVRSTGNGRIEFFDIGGDPKELMAWMVKNPGLMPGMDSLTNGDVGRKKKMLAEIMHGCYLATHMSDSVTGRSFTPDVLMANPPSFAHIHLAEAFGLPLHLTFCMPWTPTVEFSHPLVNVQSSTAKPGLTNYLSYGVADLFTWSGLSGIINKLRRNTLGIPPLTGRSGPGVVDRLRVPYTYCWSPSVIPKPKDWRNTTDISGFYFLDGSTGYQPPAELDAFLRAGEAPIYIGFGSVPVSDPAALSAIIFEAVEQAGVRAVVSVGWSGLGGVDIDPRRVFLLGDTPHDWLFKHVRAVVHHGGAGTTAIGLLNGCPTVICPWFGDQPWWASAVHSAGAGPPGIPGRQLTTEKLVEALRFVCTPESAKAARAMGEKIRQEDGIQAGVDSLHRHLPLKNMRCDVDPSQVATWWSRALCLRLCPLVAQVLADAGKIKMSDLEVHRPKEYPTRKQPTDPISGGATAVLAVVANYTAGIAQIFYNPPKGLLNSTTAIPKGIFDTLIGISEGFGNLPRSYGSEVRTVNDRDVTGFVSGLEEGSKALAYGITDSVVGLVMEPIRGGKKEGIVGVAKGVGQSWLNLVMRPAAGALALVALPAQGTMRKLEGTKSKQLPAVREIRLKQGQDAFALASPEIKRQILAKFKELEGDTKARRKAYKAEFWRFLGTNPQKIDRKGKGKEDELVAPPPLGLVDGPEDDEEEADVPWLQPPGYGDVVDSRATSPAFSSRQASPYGSRPTSPRPAFS